MFTPPPPPPKKKKKHAVTHNYGFLAPLQNSEKSNNFIPRKHPDRAKEGQILFCRMFPATARNPTSTTAIDWHLKSQK